MIQIDNKYKKKEAFNLTSKKLLVMHNVLTDYKKERPRTVTQKVRNFHPNYYTLRYFNYDKNPRTKVRGVLGFLNTSKTDFAYLTTEVTSFCKISFLSINLSEKEKEVNKI